MGRQWARHLRPGQAVDEIYRLDRRRLVRPERGGAVLETTLRDVSGEARGYVAGERRAREAFESLAEGGYVRVAGVVEGYAETAVVRVDTLQPVDPDTVESSAFVPVGPAERERMVADLRAIQRAMADPHLSRLLGAFLDDDEFRAVFVRSPAAVRNHHAYPGGLLQHVHSLVHLALVVADHYEDLDRDLLATGAFLHDIGKTRELDPGPPIRYTTEGELVGHLAIGVSMLERRIAALDAEPDAPAFPEDLRLRLVHMILSHHGKLEWGAPLVPRTLEAIVLHQIDNLDARSQIFERVTGETADEARFTPFVRALGARLYRGEPDHDAGDGSTR